MNTMGDIDVEIAAFAMDGSSMKLRAAGDDGDSMVVSSGPLLFMSSDGWVGQNHTRPF